MPRSPSYRVSMDLISDSLFAELEDKLASFPGETYSLHLGDTWKQPPPGCRTENVTLAEHPNMYRYSAPHGTQDLIDAIAQQTTSRSGVPTANDEVAITVGANGAIASAIGALLAPGEEIIVLAPYWPLITGIAHSFLVKPSIIPFYGAFDSPEEAVKMIRPRITANTTAIYVNSPNNPTGSILSKKCIEAILDLAIEFNLWVISDEVYRDFTYGGEHTYCRAIAADSTLEVQSFSKTYGMAGNRCGYIVGPRSAIKQIRKLNTHIGYGTSVATQIAASRTLDGRGYLWLEETKREYATVRSKVSSMLKVKPPEGGLYFFLDISNCLDGRPLSAFLEACLAEGLLVCPGDMFGPYEQHIRVCFVSCPPRKVSYGIQMLDRVLSEW